MKTAKEIRNKYFEETGRNSMSIKYVHWLEKELVKLFSMHHVVGRSETSKQLMCHHCGKKPRPTGIKVCYDCFKTAFKAH